MPDVKWVKITTDMFNNPKIKHLRRLPDGNSIVLVWVMLLTMAGRCNAGGMIFLTENIPYTPKMLADELDFEESTITLALKALEELGMIQTDGFLAITSWEEHQNVEGLDKIREQTRERVAKYRANQKQLMCNVTSNATVTQGNATEREEEREKEIDSLKENGKEKSKRFTPPTLEEVTAYCFERGNNVDPQRFIDYYTSNGWMVGRNKMKDWKATVRNWEKKDNDRPAQKPAKKNDFHKFQQHDYDMDAIERMLDLQDIAEVEAMRKGGG